MDSVESPPPDSAPQRDGRVLRSVRTKSKILAACRAQMTAGVFRPTAPVIARDAGISVRSVFEHFESTDALYVVALQDQFVRASILGRVLGDVDRTVHAIVFGKVPNEV